MRTHTCGSIQQSDVGTSVQLGGWVNSRRDHGGVIFIDLRDASGIVQVVFDPQDSDNFFIAESVRSEYVLKVQGTVRERPEGTENESISTGQVEVLAESVDILNTAENLPFQIDDTSVNEALRLKYRYLDLRRDTMQRNLRLRHRVIRMIRSFLDDESFTEIETPVLTRSTPEGARDYLVPSRMQTGSFYALPQSPQMFKQMLVISGFERYYQIARCFRDEDLRADRQPEFTQLDVEMAFVNETDIMGLMDRLFRQIFREICGVEFPDPLPVLDYEDAMSRYGTDRPNLQVPLELVELSEIMQNEEFQVFRKPASMSNGRVAALNVPGASGLSRQKIDEYTKFVGDFGAKGLAYIKVDSPEDGRDGLKSPIVKFLSDQALLEIVNKCGSKSGDMIFFGADEKSIVNASLGALRVRVAQDLDLVDSNWQLLWVVNFPLVEYDSDNQRFVSLHHPFTAPRSEDVERIESDPSSVLSRAYDMVLNGVEIGGGSIRNHRIDVQRQIFRMLGLNDQMISDKFGFLLDSLRCGAPPHGGIAFGLDRICAILCGENSIRDVIAFPQTQRAHCPLTDAPNRISADQLNELELRIKPTAAAITEASKKHS